MPKITSESTVYLNESAFSASVGDELVLFDPVAGAYFGSGSVGAKIWELIGEGAVVKEICASLLADFGIDSETCQREVMEFLGELEKNGLITVK